MGGEWRVEYKKERDYGSRGVVVLHFQLQEKGTGRHCQAVKLNTDLSVLRRKTSKHTNKQTDRQSSNETTTHIPCLPSPGGSALPDKTFCSVHRLFVKVAALHFPTLLCKSSHREYRRFLLDTRKSTVYHLSASVASLSRLQAF